MANKVKAGSAIRLRLQLADEESSVFPQAELLNQAGASVGSSPIDLSHIGSGLYVDDSESMPAIPVVYAIYKVYSDSGHTARHPIHSDTLLDVFERDIDGETIDNINTNINALVAGSLPGQELIGFLESEAELIGSLYDDGYLVGSIFDGESLVGIIEDPDTLIGFLYSNDELIGTINC